MRPGQSLSNMLLYLPNCISYRSTNTQHTHTLISCFVLSRLLDGAKPTRDFQKERNGKVVRDPTALM